MYNIDWTKIKGGAKGFENLARDYVQEVYHFPRGEWKKSPDTHDGNKDAYTIIIGFEAEQLGNEVWWMEAKYSHKKEYTSRFRLDATIVSSLFNDKVTKIIFVTNTDIKAKVISDVRAALSLATNCQEVCFCTKKILEYWLYNHVDIYTQYFDIPLTVINNTDDLFVSEEISIYTPSNGLGVIEPLLNIISNQEYLAYFKIISNCMCTVKITSAQKGLKRCSNIREKIYPGENVLCVRFIIKDDFFKHQQQTYDGIIMPNLCLFKLNNKIDVMAHYNIKISYNEYCQLKIESQEIFRKDFFAANLKHEGLFWFVSGVSGMGKTTTIKQCIEQSKHKFGNSFYFKFTNKKNNLIGIINMILFLFFPYISSEEITVEYINSIQMDYCMKEFVLNILSKKDDCEKLEKYILFIIEKDIVAISKKININSRTVFLDDLHSIDNISLKFLIYVLNQIQHLPVFCIMAGYPTFHEMTEYREIVKKPLLKKYSFELCSKDIITNLNILFKFPFDIDNGLLDYFFPNMIVFNLYIKYVREYQKPISDINAFILTYIYFKNNYISSEYITKQFNTIFSTYPSAACLCEKIYKSSSGINVMTERNTDIAILLNHQLIKYDDQNMLVPIHDIYLKHFLQLNRISMPTDNPLETTKNNLLQTDKVLINMDVYKKIKKLRFNEKFYSVNYILEGIFESPEKEKYHRLWGDEMFYLMYFEYAYAAINCNCHIIGYDCLEIIYNNIQNTSSEKLMILNLEIIFELINSYYQDGKYNKCREYFRVFEKRINTNIKRGLTNPNRLNNLFYVLSTNYMILIDSEENNNNVLKIAEARKNFLKNNYYHHYIDFLLQFAHTTYISNWRLSCKWIHEAYNAINTLPTSSLKQKHKVYFRYYLTKMLNSKKGIFSLVYIKNEMNQMKSEYYSSYRHKNFIYCAILYIIDSIQEADTLLFKDIASSRELRTKMRGYYFQLLALHYIKHDSFEMAKKYLTKSLDYCCPLASYTSIINHNLSLLEQNKTKLKYAICISPMLNDNTYYIDPRME